MTTRTQPVETSYNVLSDDDIEIADQIVREAAVLLAQRYSVGLPSGGAVSTSSALAVILQATVALMAEIEADATSQMLTLMALSMGDDQTNIPTRQAAMLHQHEKLMQAELRLRASADAAGNA